MPASLVTQAAGSGAKRFASPDRDQIAIKWRRDRPARGAIMRASADPRNRPDPPGGDYPADDAVAE